MTDSPSHSADPSPELPPGAAEIPRAAVGRLSLYLRELRRLAGEGIGHASSGRLGKLLGVSDAVVRRDLGHLGPMGRRGVGYEVEPLIERIRQTLGSDVLWNVALVGAGSLGNALLRYRGFEDQGFRLVAAFDIDPRRIGTSVGGIPILALDDFEQQVRQHQIVLAILAVPADVAPATAKRVADAGVAGILNFAPVTLQTGGATCVANVDLASELQQLAFSVVRQLSGSDPAR